MSLLAALVAWMPSAAADLGSGDPRRAVAVIGTAGRLDTDGARTCAILDGGSLHCWGAGSQGPLGYPEVLEDVGDDEYPLAVGPVFLGSGRTAKAVSVGGSHICAIRDDDSLLCWGDGWHGALGYGNEHDIGDNESPAAAGPVDLGPGRTVGAVTVGTSHTCAILDDGTVRCWGYYSAGRLGYPYYPAGGGPPTAESIGDDETPASVGPVDLGRGRTARAISAGGSHTCAILDDGTVRCWGDLGPLSSDWVGDDETPGSVAPADLGSGRTATAISAGASRTCAILDDDSTRCWGAIPTFVNPGDYEWIGDDEPADALGPLDLGAGRAAASISIGSLHTCAVLDDGTVRCWGEESFGKLGHPGLTEPVGDNEPPGSLGPVDLGRARTATAVTAGLHSCAVLDTGRLRCWGWNYSGQLGYASTDHVGDDETPAAAGPVRLGGLLTARPPNLDPTPRPPLTPQP